ncbi:MAG: FtsX-like permease family protein [Gammaproteobacteria bacterium]|nr:FtsX-like permease family protein [Gammaproteobacteria bacterium]NIR85979.1 FtsX-like permease family protein [Gammaproteobacteria bacterium]NIR91970.1 FtsX-like permease family protein [Gammaproteobacteria bacterium]NIU07220.1 FtsX-like permease family protein [Gammaproteobacteria bacterium]NIV54023.1 FtsX-like permease family protein [Gammaproteobacteria bacterium]
MIALALRLLRRDWRAGELRVLVLALIIAVGSISSVGFVADRVERAMHLQANEMLAADLVVSSSVAIHEAIRETAQERGLRTARTLTFRSMLGVGGRLQLVEVKAVDAGYPLRGRLRTSAEPFGPEHPSDTIPQEGTVWIEPRLASLLRLAAGDSIELGEARLRVARMLTYEPDRGADLFSIAPRVLMNLGDVADTGLVQPGSRVTHGLLMAGAPERIGRFRSWLEENLGPAGQIQGVRDARPRLRVALERAERFLGLAALVSVLLVGAAVALSAQRYATRHLDTAALLRCLGVRQRTVTGMYLVQLVVIGLLGSIAGCLLGYGVHEALAALARPLAFADLPPPGWRPLPLAFTAGLVVLVGFALPPLMRLRHVPPARILHRDLSAGPTPAWLLYGLALAAVATLALQQAQDVRLGLYALGAGTATVAALGAASWLLVLALGRLRARVGITWRFGLANVSRRAGSSVTQILAFGLGTMGLLLLTLVRGDLLAQWQRTLPPDTPNYFLVNVQPGEVARLEGFLAARGLDDVRLYPIVRGQLVAIDGRPVSPEDYDSRRAKHLATHDFNMSWAANLLPENRIATGQWWDQGSGEGTPQFSVEHGLAQTLGIALGDRLTFEVAGQRISGLVSSLRTVAWDSFRPNFFVLAPPGMLEGYPAQYITSFHLPRTRAPMLTELVRTFPSVTVLDVDALLTRVRSVMDRAALAVQYVFAFSLLAGLTVLYAAIQATLDERRLETAILRALGADRRRILGGLAAEFGALGALAGAVGALAAAGTAALMAGRIFDFTYRLDPWMALLGAAGGTTVIVLAGLLGARSVLDAPPERTLRAL